jgi:metal-responsive CopG/Arc/MetJ family transcriptional regulator
MKRLNITIPEELSRDLKEITNKSRFIVEALKEKMERERKKKFDDLLIEAYKSLREEDKEINDEWEKITLEGWT